MKAAKIFITLNSFLSIFKFEQISEEVSQNINASVSQKICPCNKEMLSLFFKLKLKQGNLRQTKEQFVLLSFSYEGYQRYILHRTIIELYFYYLTLYIQCL